VTIVVPTEISNVAELVSAQGGSRCIEETASEESESSNLFPVNSYSCNSPSVA